MLRLAIQNEDDAGIRLEWVWRKMEVVDTNFSCSTNLPEAAALKRDYLLAFDAAKVPATHAELLEKAEAAVKEWLDHAKDVPEGTCSARPKA
jgi:hypothetical protein